MDKKERNTNRIDKAKKSQSGDNINKEAQSR
jgi:hypothetical protein